MSRAAKLGKAGRGLGIPALYDTPILPSYTVKYLGLTLDQRPTWAHHIRTKRLSLNNHLRMLSTILCNTKYTSVGIKLLMYKSLLKPTL